MKDKEVTAGTKMKCDSPSATLPTMVLRAASDGMTDLSGETATTTMRGLLAEVDGFDAEEFGGLA